jgi:integration host factor subunit alpha
VLLQQGKGGGRKKELFLEREPNQSTLAVIKVTKGKTTGGRTIALGRATPGKEERVTKADIVERLYERVGLPKQEVSDVVESVFELIKGRLEKGEKVKISGFGNFAVRQKQARRGRNPQTGETITLPGRRVMSFKASPLLKDALNQQ